MRETERKRKGEKIHNDCQIRRVRVNSKYYFCRPIYFYACEFYEMRAYFSKEFSITLAYLNYAYENFHLTTFRPKCRKAESRTRLKRITPYSSRVNIGVKTIGYICIAHERHWAASMFNAAANSVIGSGRLKRTITSSRLVCSSVCWKLNSRRRVVIHANFFFYYLDVLSRDSVVFAL